MKNKWKTGGKYGVQVGKTNVQAIGGKKRHMRNKWRIGKNKSNMYVGNKGSEQYLKWL